jgi:hypothetical protein
MESSLWQERNNPAPTVRIVPMEPKTDTAIDPTRIPIESTSSKVE